jgi:hypothetical protein
MGSFLEAN